MRWRFWTRLVAALAAVSSATGCLPVTRTWQDVIPIPAGVPEGQRETFAQSFVSRDRYHRMCAAAKLRFDLETQQTRSLFLHWRKSGPLGGPQEVALVVGIAYRGHMGNAAQVVQFCREFLERDLDAALRSKATLFSTFGWHGPAKKVSASARSG